MFQNISAFLIGENARVVHHNQLLSTKFGRILRYVKNNVNSASKLSDYSTVNREDLGTRLSCFTRVPEEEIGELLAKNKNSKKTTRWRTSAIWKIFAELKTLYILRLPINMHPSKLSVHPLIEVSMF